MAGSWEADAFRERVVKVDVMKRETVLLWAWLGLVVASCGGSPPEPSDASMSDMDAASMDLDAEPARDAPVASEDGDGAVGDVDGGGTPGGGNVVALDGGTYAMCAVRASGTLHCWGPVAGLPPDVSGVAVGFRHTCAVTAEGEVWCWGANEFGQLGDGTITARSTPGRVVGLSGPAQSVAASYNHTCALLRDGGVQCWGAGASGQVTGRNAINWAPVTVRLPRPAVAIGAGYAHNCAVLDDGSIQCWGLNRNGQLGNGMMEEMREQPVAVVGLAGPATAVAPGGEFTCARLATGDVQCWGRNRDEEIGIDSRENDVLAPATLSLGGMAASVVAGLTHACAPMADGTVRCWGSSWDGQAGIGERGIARVPTLVSGLPGPVEVVGAGDRSSCAALVDGSVYCWGKNDNGQLGDGTRMDRYAPVRVTALP